MLTHPHPLERPESAWLCTSADTTSPSVAMNVLRSSLVVPHDRFPTKTVLLTGAASAAGGGAGTGAGAKERAAHGRAEGPWDNTWDGEEGGGTAVAMCAFCYDKPTGFYGKTIFIPAFSRTSK